MRKWVGTSWKMNGTLGAALDYAATLSRAEEAGLPGLQPFVIPPITVARQVKAALAATPVLVGAQNMHWEDAGAWTGEISAPMLVDCGLDLVEIGHSERRLHFGETDDTVALKVASALRHGLVPLVCIGETREERDRGDADARLRQQVERALGRVDGSGKSSPILLAYEPVWAIGAAGAPAEPGYADARMAGIARTAHDLLGVPVPCLYGGSVSQANCADLIRRPHVDGLFIGRAAWTAAGYLAILQLCAAALTREEEME